MQIQTIAEQLLFSTIRVETDTAQGVGAGTAFIFSYTWDDKNFLCLVTNKHVVKGAINGRFFFTLRDGEQPLIGQRFDVHVDSFEGRWHGHPNPEIDVSILPLMPILQEIERTGKQVYFRAITHDLIPTAEQSSGLDAIEEVVFIGYPNGIFDTRNLMPIARRGTTATHPQIDYEGKPIFLIDASVFPGSSGSPVLIANLGGYSNRGGFVVGSRIHFLGIIARVAIREEQGKIDFISVPTAQIPILRTQQMLDLGIVYKAHTVVDTVTDFLRKHSAIQ